MGNRYSVNRSVNRSVSNSVNNTAATNMNKASLAMGLLLVVMLTGCSSLLTRTAPTQDPQVLAAIVQSDAATRRLFDRYQDKLPSATVKAATREVRQGMEDIAARIALHDSVLAGADRSAKQVTRLLRLFDRATKTRFDQQFKPWRATQASHFKTQLSLAHRELYRTEKTKRTPE